MAKVSFIKMGLKLNNAVNTLIIGNQLVEIKSYLPYEEKLQLVSNIISQSIDENGYWNSMRVEFFMLMEIIYAYTNINFTDKMKEEAFKTYDILMSTGVANQIIAALNETEYNFIRDNVYKIIHNIYTYKNSAMGILETIANDYSDLNLDLDELGSKLRDPESLTLLKDIVNQLG